MKLYSVLKCVVIIGVFSFVLGHVSGIVVGVCLMIVGYKLQRYGRSHSQHVPTDVINMEVSRTLPDNLIHEEIKEVPDNYEEINEVPDNYEEINEVPDNYEEINEVAITNPRESLQLQENIAYGNNKKVIYNP